MSNANLYALFRSRFPQDPTDRLIETPDGECWSYAELERETARLARCLDVAGVRKGDRVIAQVDKSPHALFLYLACVRGGFVYVPLNTDYTQREVAYFIANAEPRVVVGRPEAAAMLQALVADRAGVVHTLDDRGGGTLLEASGAVAPEFPIAPCQPDDLAAILYTSGTTGRPKGAMITHGNLAANGLTLHQAWGWQPGDVLLHALPIYHAHGLFVACHCARLNGSKILFLPGFDAATVLAGLPRATVFMGVPTYYTRLLAHPGFTREICRGMRLFISGSAPLLASTFEAFQVRTGQAILERYGMTETEMNTSNPLRGDRIAGTVGLPLPGVTVRLVDDQERDVPVGAVGQLLVRGRNVFPGYWRLPEQTAQEFTADGWFKTGDLGRQDARGYITLVGRAKDLIITGGLNVYPKEVEACLDALEGVLESAVIGLPHPDFGEAVAAVVVRAPGRAAVTEAALIDRIKGELAGFKIPKRIFFTDHLPRNAMGKVQKNVLRAHYAPATAG